MNMHTVKTTHPSIIIAAISLAVLALVGSAAILGWIPGSHGAPAPAPESVSEAVTAHKLAAGTAVETPRVESRAVASRPAPARHAAARPVKAEPVQVASAPVADRSEPVAAKDETPVQVAQAEPARRICYECGTVESVRETEKPAETNGVGIGVGAVTGGILGHQMGRGNGNTAMTVLGAIGGAIAGHQIEKKVRTVKEYRVTVRFEDGTTQQVVSSTPPAWHEGDRVKVMNGSLISNG